MSAKFYQQLTTILVMGSFVAANLGVGRAFDIWTSPNGWLAISGFFALGVGMKMAKDVGMAIADKPAVTPKVDIKDSSVTVEAQKAPVAEGEVLRSPEGQ